SSQLLQLQSVTGHRSPVTVLHLHQSSFSPMLLTRSRFTVSSERMVRSTSAGELLTAARSRAARRLATSGAVSAFAIAAFSFATTSCGVPLGAKAACHGMYSASG